MVLFRNWYYGIDFALLKLYKKFQFTPPTHNSINLSMFFFFFFKYGWGHKILKKEKENIKKKEKELGIHKVKVASIISERGHENPDERLSPINDYAFRRSMLISADPSVSGFRKGNLMSFSCGALDTQRDASEDQRPSCLCWDRSVLRCRLPALPASPTRPAPPFVILGDAVDTRSRDAAVNNSLLTSFEIGHVTKSCTCCTFASPQTPT